MRAAATGGGDELPETVLAMMQRRLDEIAPEPRRVLRAASVFGAAFWTGRPRRARRAPRRRAARRDPRRSRRARARPATQREPLPRRRASGRSVTRSCARRSTARSPTRTARSATAGRRVWLVRAGERDAVTIAEHFERGQDIARRPPSGTCAPPSERSPATTGARRSRAPSAACRSRPTRRRGPRRAAPRGRAGVHVERRRAARGARGDRGRDAARARLGSLVRRRGGGRQRRGHGARSRRRRARVGRRACSRRGTRATDVRTPPRSPRRARSRRCCSRAIASARHAAARAARGHRPHRGAARRGAPLSRAGVVGVSRARRTSARTSSSRAPALERLVAAGDERSAAQQRTSLGYGLTLLGAPGDRDACSVKGSSRPSASGCPLQAGTHRQNLGLVLARQGRFGEALAVERASIEAFREAGDKRFEAASHVYLSTILEVAGDFEGAESEAKRRDRHGGELPGAQGDGARRARRGAPRSRRRAVAALEARARAMALVAELGALEEGEEKLRLDARAPPSRRSAARTKPSARARRRARAPARARRADPRSAAGARASSRTSRRTSRCSTATGSSATGEPGLRPRFATSSRSASVGAPLQPCSAACSPCSGLRPSARLRVLASAWLLPPNSGFARKGGDEDPQPPSWWWKPGSDRGPRSHRLPSAYFSGALFAARDHRDQDASSPPFFGEAKNLGGARARRRTRAAARRAVGPSTASTSPSTRGGGHPRNAMPRSDAAQRPKCDQSRAELSASRSVRASRAWRWSWLWASRWEP